MITTLAAADGPERPFSWLAGTVNQHASGGMTTVYLDPARATTIPLFQTSFAAGYGQTLYFDIYPEAHP